jgi:hypothetical protein
MIPEALVTEAVKAVIGALTKEAVGPALAAGSRVWGWLKENLSRTDAQSMISAVEAEPAKTSVRLKLSGALAELLEEQPELAAELERELQESGYRQAVAQTVNVTGQQKYDCSNLRSREHR